MKWQLRIFPAAERDVDHAASFIATDSLAQALRFYDGVAETYKLILEAPARWPVCGVDHPKLTGLRKRAVLKFSKYLVFYHMEARSVDIVRVLHGARDLAVVLRDSAAND